MTGDTAGLAGRLGRECAVRRFTLVELLTVLIIMVLLMGIALPAFNKLTIGTGVDAAARAVGGQLRLARQHAIAQRQRVALLMPADDGNIQSSRKYVSFRPCTVSVGNVFDGWIPNTKWEFLPAGTVIAEADGDLDSAATNWADDGGTTTRVTGVHEDIAGTTVNYSSGIRAVLFHPTGRLDPTEIRYVTVAEGFYDGGSLRPRNRDNYRIMELEVYTGRVTFRDQ